MIGGKKFWCKPSGVSFSKEKGGCKFTPKNVPLNERNIIP